MRAKRNVPSVELLVNQNFHPGWRSVDGRPVGEQFGIIATPVRPAESSVELYFHPRGFYEGALVGLVTLAGLGVAALRSRRRERSAPR